MAGLVPFRNICAIFNCIAFKLLLWFNFATSYTRKPLSVSLKTALDLNICSIYFEADEGILFRNFQILVFGFHI